MELALLVGALWKEVGRLRSENAALREKLGENSRNSSKPPSRDPTALPRHRDRPRSGRRAGGQRGHRGRRRELVDEPDRVHDVDARRCESCGSQNVSRTDEGPRRHQVVEIPAAPSEVDEWRMHQAKCLDCRHRFWPSLPASVATGGFGKRLQATIAYMTGTLRLSRRMTEQALADLFGVPISLGSVSATEKVVSTVLAEPVNEAHRAACAQPVAHIDETGWRHHHGKAWLWALWTTVAVVFKIATDRGHKAFHALIKGFDGVLESDRWVVYDEWDVLKRQLCWAHLERTWEKFVERGGASARIGRALLDETHRMFRWWHKVRDGTMTREHFRRHMVSLMDRVHALLNQGMRLRSHPKTRRTCTRIRKLAPALWTFIEVEGVEPTNNVVERRIRAGVQWRASSLGTQSEAGREYAERMLTVTATLRQHGRNVYAYLVEAMHDHLHHLPAPSLLHDSGIKTIVQAA
jgi:transposase